MQYHQNRKRAKSPRRRPLEKKPPKNTFPFLIIKKKTSFNGLISISFLATTTRLKSLSLEERFEIFSIKNSWLAIAFVKMYKRWSESHDTVFALLVEESKKPRLPPLSPPLSSNSFSSHDKSSLEFGELDNHFYCRKQIPMTNPEKQVLIEKAEKVKKTQSQPCV